MDRKIVQYGQLPLDTDLLGNAQYSMVGLAKLAEAMLGSATIIDGFLPSPTVPASMQLTVGPGQVYQQAQLEATAMGTLPVDTHTIVKQGIQLDAINLGFSAPTTQGQTQVFLIEAAYQDFDTGQQVRPYFNAANPQQPFQGPGNAGTSENTVRKGGVALQIKAGIAATTGSQVGPVPDPGFVGLYYITVSSGQTTITAGNITPYGSAPFIPVKLPAVPTGVQNGKWTYAQDTGTSDSLAINLSPTPPAIGEGFLVHVKKGGNANATTSPAITINTLAGPQTFNIIKSSGGVIGIGDLYQNSELTLICDATGNFRHVGLTKSDVISIINNNTAPTTPLNNDTTLWHEGSLQGSGSAFTVTLTPPPKSDEYGINMRLTVGNNTNTANTTLDFGYGPKPIIINQTAQPLAGGEFIPSEAYTIDLFYDGTNVHLLNVSSIFSKKSMMFVSNTQTITVPAGMYWMQAEAVGGGGGGSNGNGWAGQAGGYGKGWYPVTPGQQIPVTIGAGGAADTAGGTTSVGSFMSCVGGSGGTPNPTGGQVSGAQFAIPGTPGGQYYQNNNGVATSGPGGPSPFYALSIATLASTGLNFGSGGNSNFGNTRVSGLGGAVLLNFSS